MQEDALFHQKSVLRSNSYRRKKKMAPPQSTSHAPFTEWLNVSLRRNFKPEVTRQSDWNSWVPSNFSRRK